jgi:hypothetical protein
MPATFPASQLSVKLANAGAARSSQEISSNWSHREEAFVAEVTDLLVRYLAR